MACIRFKVSGEDCLRSAGVEGLEKRMEITIEFGWRCYRDDYKDPVLHSEITRGM